MIFYKDGFIENTDLRLHPDDRGYCFGDGIYEVFRVYGGKMFEKAAHFQRLVHSAAGTRIQLPYPIEGIERKLEQLMLMNKLVDGMIYMQITRGVAPRAHHFPAGADPILYAYCSAMYRPLHAICNGIAALTRPDTRWLRCDLKTLNLLPNVLARQEAADQGAEECIFHRNGIVTECTAANLMIIKNGRLLTHPANHLILKGITRALVLRLAAAIGLAFAEEPFHLKALGMADEVFITGTMMEITPVIAIDGKPVGSGRPGKYTRQLQEAYERMINLSSVST